MVRSCDGVRVWDGRQEGGEKGEEGSQEWGWRARFILCMCNEPDWWKGIKLKLYVGEWALGNLGWFGFHFNSLFEFINYFLKLGCCYWWWWWWWWWNFPFPAQPPLFKFSLLLPLFFLLLLPLFPPFFLFSPDVFPGRFPHPTHQKKKSSRFSLCAMRLAKSFHSE